MPATAALLAALAPELDGDIVTPDHPDYDDVRRPAQPVYDHVRPRAIVRCRSVRDVVAAIGFARQAEEPIAVRGGGHCFAGRSSTQGLLLDMAGLDSITTDDGATVIGAGARLAPVYAALHAHRRTLPAGCGAGVGIAGLTLGGGIGLLGRRYGLTCDRLVAAQVVLADSRIVQCDDATEPELFWALRGAGGGQFGVVTELRFAAVEEPRITSIGLSCSDVDPTSLILAWQDWAPDAPDAITLDLSIVREIGEPVHASLLGACTLDEDATRKLMRDFCRAVPGVGEPDLRGGIHYSSLKTALTAPATSDATRERTEFFTGPLTHRTVEHLLRELESGSPAGARRLAFTAMGGAYNAVPADATAFAHRSERFLVEHVGTPDDAWVDVSWSVTHPDGSGHVYPNFPDPLLDDPYSAYHGANHARLVAVKNAYDPEGFFDFPQAIRPTRGG